jgi:hypothetical protein
MILLHRSFCLHRGQYCCAKWRRKPVKLTSKTIISISFVPLSPPPQPIKERLRSLGNQYRLAVDVLDYAPHVEKAVRYALGDVVVCDNLGDARKLCFQDRERVKAVTLRGEIISKNGDMTGGTTDADRGHASRFEQKELNNRRAERESLEREIGNLDRALVSGLVGDAGATGKLFVLHLDTFHQIIRFLPHSLAIGRSNVPRWLKRTRKAVTRMERTKKMVSPLDSSSNT